MKNTIDRELFNILASKNNIIIEQLFNGVIKKLTSTQIGVKSDLYI